MNNNHRRRRVRRFLAILEAYGFRAGTSTVILDFGCGNCETVLELRTAGYQAFGCDLVLPQQPEVQRLQQEGVLRLIENDPYRLPFGAGTFDLVLSDHVLEHVRDYATTVAEMRRVLKPGGASLHVFPSRYRLIEPHFHVPLATLIQQRWWLSAWARVGIRNIHQRGLSHAVTTAQNHELLNRDTHYLSKTAIQQYFHEYFATVSFSEQEYLKHSLKAKWLYHALRRLPFLKLDALFSTMHTRVVLATNHKPDRDPRIEEPDR